MPFGMSILGAALVYCFGSFWWAAGSHGGMHLMLAVWLDGGGYSFSETARVGADGPELLSTLPRTLLVTP